MKILAIETSCDETALALLEATGGLRAPKFKILKNLVSSQIEIHRPWGGVVPNLAKREHIKNLPLVFEELIGGKKIHPVRNLALTRAPEGPLGRAISNGVKPDLLAVTVGPGAGLTAGTTA